MIKLQEQLFMRLSQKANFKYDKNGNHFNLEKSKPICLPVEIRAQYNSDNFIWILRRG